MRHLKFINDELSKKRFEVLLHGLVVLGNQNTSKGLTVLKTELSILDKLEGISKPCECGKTLPGGKESDRELNFEFEETLEFTLSDQEFDLLYDYISKVPWAIGAPSRLAIATLDWLFNGSPTS